MRLLLALMLTLSVGLNVLQLKTESNLVREKAELQTSLDSYKELFDAVEMEAHELEAISATLREKNSHVPTIVIDNWAKAIQQGSNLYDISVNITMQLLRVESAKVHYSEEGFITVSHAGAGGIGQIMNFWYKDCPHSTRPKDLDNASINIMCSAYILRQYVDMVTNEYGVRVPEQAMFLALTAYNAGPSGVRLMMRGRDITQGYARNAMTGKTWRI